MHKRKPLFSKNKRFSSEKGIQILSFLHFFRHKGKKEAISSSLRPYFGPFVHISFTAVRYTIGVRLLPKGVFALKFKPHTYRLTHLQFAFVLLAALTAAAVVLRCVALALFFDAHIGYFREGTGLMIDLYNIEGLAALGCAALPFLIKKETLSETEGALSIGGLVGAGLTALMLAVTAVYLLLKRNELHAPAILLWVTALFSVVSAGYFATQFREHPDRTTTLVLGYGSLFGSALLLAVTYFDLYTQMNAPHKVSQHVALLAVMIAMLFELRPLASAARPHLRAATCALAFFTTATVGISNAIGFLIGAYESVLYLFIDLVLVGLAVYFGAKCVSLCLYKKEEKEVEEA